MTNEDALVFDEELRLQCGIETVVEEVEYENEREWLEMLNALENCNFLGVIIITNERCEKLQKNKKFS